MLTSMEKRVDTVVYETIRRLRDGKFEGGVQSFGLEDDAVGYSLDEHNEALIPASLRAVADSLGAEIIAGRIRVPRE